MFKSFLKIVFYVITFLINLYRECSTDTIVDFNPNVLLAQTVCADREKSGIGYSAITGTRVFGSNIWALKRSKKFFCATDFFAFSF